MCVPFSPSLLAVSTARWTRTIGTRRPITDRVETHLDILAVNGPLPDAVSRDPW